MKRKKKKKSRRKRRLFELVAKAVEVLANIAAIVSFILALFKK